LILSVFFSFACHTAVLSLTTLIDWKGSGGKSKTTKIIHVDFPSDPLPPETMKAADVKSAAVRPPKPKTLEKLPAAHSATAYPEDTVDLNAQNSTYTPYLQKIKRRIDYSWRYPRQSYAVGEEGVTVVKFSIDRTGTLVADNIQSSSGSNILDRGVLEAVQAAAPYEQLPDDMKLSRLHIIATFHYKLTK
jgi:protein TonB